MNRYLQWPGILIPIFAAGIGLSVVAIGFETDWGRNLRPSPAVPDMKAAKAPDASLLPAFALPSLEAGLPESAERPLFMPTRRPVPAASPTPRLKPGQFILVGTSRTKEFGDSAMLKEVATNKTIIVKVGGPVQDMILDSVGPDRAVLKLGDDKEELVMKARPASRPPGAPGAPNVAPVPGQPAAPGVAAQTVAPGAGIFGSLPANIPTNIPATPLPPAAQIPPGAPGSPTVFPGAPGSTIGNPAATANTPATNRAPTPEEILERRRRARAQQQQQ